jgi:hypothetical protein
MQKFTAFILLSFSSFMEGLMKAYTAVLVTHCILTRQVITCADQLCVLNTEYQCPKHSES